MANKDVFNPNKKRREEDDFYLHVFSYLSMNVMLVIFFSLFNTSFPMSKLLVVTIGWGVILIGHYLWISGIFQSKPKENDEFLAAWRKLEKELREEEKTKRIGGNSEKRA